MALVHCMSQTPRTTTQNSTDLNLTHHFTDAPPRQFCLLPNLDVRWVPSVPRCRLPPVRAGPGPRGLPGTPAVRAVRWRRSDRACRGLRAVPGIRGLRAVRGLRGSRAGPVWSGPAGRRAPAAALSAPPVGPAGLWRRCPAPPPPCTSGPAECLPKS